MIEKICENLTKKIRQEVPDIDDERAEIISYGLQLLFGEIPKVFIMAGIAWVLGIFEWTLITFALMLPYRMYSGGFHLKSHIGCIIRNINNVYRKCIYKQISCNSNTIQNYTSNLYLVIFNCNGI